MTPLEDFMAERKEKMTAGAKEGGDYGAFCRLMLMMDTTVITEWISQERKRGTSENDIAVALGNHIANAIAPFCIHAPATAPMILYVALDCFQTMISGQQQVGVLAVNSNDGRQIDMTAHGIVEKGLPK